MEECINEKIRFQQMETSVRGDEFPVEAEKISHVLAFSSRRQALSKNSAVVSISNEACKPSKQFVVTAGSDMESMYKGSQAEEREGVEEKKE